MKKRIIFCLGSNLGNRERNLNQAIENLILMLELSKIKKSNILQNEAMMPYNAPKSWNIDFLNIAISADINLEKFDVLKILKICKIIEEKLGRKERERWAPREIDIDILAIEDLFFDYGKKLKIPHQELFNRDFFKIGFNSSIIFSASFKLLQYMSPLYEPETSGLNSIIHFLQLSLENLNLSKIKNNLINSNTFFGSI